MTSHAKVKNYDPRLSSYLTGSTGRLPYAAPARPLIPRAQSCALIVLSILGIVLIVNIIALDVFAVLLYLNFFSLPLPTP